MKIGISGPILIEPFKKYLETTVVADISGVKGMGGTAVHTLAQGLLEHGHELVLFSMDTKANEEIVLNGPRLRICVGPCRSSARERVFDFFRLEREYIQRAVEREKPDIVHAHWTYEYALGALASGAPTLVTVRDWAPLILWYNRGNYRTFGYRAARLVMDWMTCKRARHLSANSPYIREKILKRWNKDAPVIPNPIADYFLRQEDRSYPSNGVNIITVMNGMGARKNPITLIRAFALIRKAIPEAILRLIGVDYEVNGKAHSWAKTNGLEKGCEFVGPLDREQLVSAIDNASLMIHPAREESFGNVLIEAMARRVPVLGGKDSGAVPWVLDHGRAGALCDVWNPEDIARAAVEILTSRERWTELSQAGYARVRQDFSLSRVVDICLNEYERILFDGN